MLEKYWTVMHGLYISPDHTYFSGVHISSPQLEWPQNSFKRILNTVTNNSVRSFHHTSLHMILTASNLRTYFHIVIYHISLFKFHIVTKFVVNRWAPGVFQTWTSHMLVSWFLYLIFPLLFIPTTDPHIVHVTLDKKY